jgi:hypothetical protein
MIRIAAFAKVHHTSSAAISGIRQSEPDFASIGSLSHLAFRSFLFWGLAENPVAGYGTNVIDRLRSGKKIMRIEQKVKIFSWVAVAVVSWLGGRPGRAARPK